MTLASHNSISPWPHRLALAVACATFPLIFVGGLVTSYDAGMAVPDWPNTFGYNLFLYPWETWFFGPWDLFIEHGHRLLGALVGLLTIGLVVAAWRGDTRVWFRRLTVVALVGVIAQGVLGGMRVNLDEVQLAKIHGCVGPAFFALAAALAAMSSRGWREARAVPFDGASKLRRMAVSTAALAYTQLVIGAHLRHLPPNMSSSAFRAVLFFHLIFAAALVAHAITLALRARSAAKATGNRSRTPLMLLALVMFQVTLGGATWVVKYGWPAWFVDSSLTSWYTVQEQSMLQASITTAHVATGSLIVAVTVLISLWSYRHIASASVTAKSAAGSFAAREVLAGILFPAAALTEGVR
jgi:cytochrome c oxidase assembly protein subunit 15